MIALRVEILVDRGVAQPGRIVARVGAHHGEEAIEKNQLVRLLHDPSVSFPAFD
jgi:hypothetical protein